MSERSFEHKGLEIRSDDPALSDFYILCMPKQFPQDKAKRWVLYWGDVIICFAQDFYTSESEFQYFDDGRIKIEINIMGIAERYTRFGVPYSVPAFKHFSSRTQQDKVIGLFLEAMNAFKFRAPHPGSERIKARAVIGSHLQDRLDKGEFLK